MNQLNEHQEKLLEEAKKSPRIGKMVLIASGFTGAGVAVAKAATEGERGVVIATKSDKEIITKKIEAEAILYNAQKMPEFDYIHEEKPSFGKMNKMLRNKRNPKKIKSKFNGKSNPFKKKS